MEKFAQPAALEAALKAKREQGPPSSGKEFSAWLDECMDLEEQLASLRETRRDGPIGPQPVDPRPRRIPRAERSPKRRPARLVDGNGLTRRDRAVYAYIRRKAKGAEAVEISNQELAYGTGYKRRSIQLATAALHCAGKVLKRERRVSPTLSLPNQFILPENRRFHEAARRTSQGAKSTHRPLIEILPSKIHLLRHRPSMMDVTAFKA